MTNKSSPQNSPSMDEETVAFASKIFNLARSTTPEDAEFLLEYVRAGVPVDLTNEDGNTLLMLSAYSGNRAAVCGLIDLGADVNRLNKRNQSIIAGALFKGEDAIVTDLKRQVHTLTSVTRRRGRQLPCLGALICLKQMMPRRMPANHC